MRRREVLTAALSAPAVALAGSLPMVAAVMPETPVMALFRQWKAHNEWINGPETNNLPPEVFSAICDDDTALIQQMILTPAQNAQDLCAKLLAVTDLGTVIGYARLEGADCLPGEARALVA